MNLVFSTNEVSPHTYPLVKRIIQSNRYDDVCYLCFRDPKDRIRTKDIVSSAKHFVSILPYPSKERHQVEFNADVLIECNRDLELIEERVLAGKKTIYISERWFKPERLFCKGETELMGGSGVKVSGFCKMMLPFAIKRARAMTRLMQSSKNFLYLPIGIAAARDMARMCGLMNGDVECVFRAPDLCFEKKAGGRIWARNGNDDKYCTNRMRMWGYFVEQGCQIEPKPDNLALTSEMLKVLWIDRMLGCKRVCDLVRAVGAISDDKVNTINVTLDIFGAGPDEQRITRLVQKYDNIHVDGFISPLRVRAEMRNHDVFVLSSNEFEGWGAVVSEALAEGCKVIGTYEAGASGTILPQENLYHAGDWKTLKEMLGRPIGCVPISGWSVADAMMALNEIIDDL